MKADEQTHAEVMDTVNGFMDAYARGDADGVMQYIAPDADVVMIGTGADEKRVGPAEARMQVERDIAQSDSIALRMGWHVMSAAGPVAWMAADVAFEGSAGGQNFRLPARFTAVFENREGAWLLVNMHVSAAMGGQQAGESFPN